MPKTKDAFAFRMFDYGVEMQERTREVAMQGNRDLAIQLSEQAEELLFLPFDRNEVADRCIRDRVKDIEQGIRNCDRSLRRADFLFKRVAAHDKRLNKILAIYGPKSSIGKRAIILQEKYTQVKDAILSYKKLINTLNEHNKKIVRTAFNEEFGNRLRVARRRKDYTQKVLAKELGIRKSTYCNYELGRREVPPFLIYRLSTLLNVSTEYLLKNEK